MANSPTAHFLPLSHEECLSLLHTQHVGRLVVAEGRYPEVFTVNYRLDGRVVVFRTNVGTKLAEADHANVAFHVDHVDDATRTGWSVLVQGVAEDVTDLGDGTARAHADALHVDPWVPGERPRVVRVIPVHISGRRLGPGLDAFWTLEPGGYL